MLFIDPFKFETELQFDFRNETSLLIQDHFKFNLSLPLAFTTQSSQIFNKSFSEFEIELCE